MLQVCSLNWEMQDYSKLSLLLIMIKSLLQCLMRFFGETITKALIAENNSLHANDKSGIRLNKKFITSSFKMSDSAPSLYCSELPPKAEKILRPRFLELGDSDDRSHFGGVAPWFPGSPLFLFLKHEDRGFTLSEHLKFWALTSCMSLLFSLIAPPMCAESNIYSGQHGKAGDLAGIPPLPVNPWGS